MRALLISLTHACRDGVKRRLGMWRCLKEVHYDAFTLHKSNLKVSLDIQIQIYKESNRNLWIIIFSGHLI